MKALSQLSRTILSQCVLILLVALASALSALTVARCAVVAVTLRRASTRGAPQREERPADPPVTQQDAFNALKQRLRKTSMCRKGGLDPDTIEDVDAFGNAITEQAQTNPLGTLKDLLSIASFCSKEMGSGAQSPSPAS